MATKRQGSHTLETTFESRDLSHQSHELDQARNTEELLANMPHGNCCVHSTITSNFINDISKHLAPLFPRAKPRPRSYSFDARFNPFAREFLCSAPEETVRLLASLCVKQTALRKPSKASRLLELPAELRLRIYGYVFGEHWDRFREDEEAALVADYNCGFKTLRLARCALGLSMLRVCRLVRSETLQEYQAFLRRELISMEASSEGLYLQVKREKLEERRHGRRARNLGLFVTLSPSEAPYGAVCVLIKRMRVEFRELEKMQAESIPQVEVLEGRVSARDLEILQA